MLRKAFETGGLSGNRELIQRLAQISISGGDGIPTRRYVP
jgi:hypothetical protein